MNGGQESRRPRPTLGCSAIDDDDIDTSIKVRHLEGAGHVVRMNDEMMVKSVSGKPRRKKETRKTKVKTDRLCGG
jgi:hypothetical protein